MTDIVDKATRSRIMSRIRGRDTNIEVRVRKALWRRGFRYRMPTRRNYLGLPGIPDLVFPKYRAVILLNGCFFHGHSCHLFRVPKQNREVWLEKIKNTSERDARFARIRRQMGWKTLTIWECALRGKHQLSFEYLIRVASDWLLLDSLDASIEGPQS